MKNILITGSNGQLGNEIRTLSQQFSNYKFIFTDVDNLDICEKNQIHNFCKKNKIQFILNCAAYTAVDKAEDEEALCTKVNTLAAKNLGEVAFENKIGIIHISTDYVFDGTSHQPYTEDMPSNPTSVYGKTKLEGEIQLMTACPNAIIIRTSWLHSSHGNNFVKTMLKLGETKDSLNVIFDQIGTPTYAVDLGAAMLNIMTQVIEDINHSKAGIYHFSNEGVCSWYDFTIKIHQLAGITNCKVSPIETKDYPTKAARPYYSLLNKTKIKTAFNIDIPHWENGLKRCLHQLETK